MTHGDFRDYSATDLAAMVRRGETSPVETVEAALNRIESDGDRTNAFITVLSSSARLEARAAEVQARSGKPVGPLHGVPVAIKDLYANKAGVRATAGSLVFADHIARNTTPYVQRLEDAGAIIIATTNTPEFGYKGTTDNALTGPTRNPHKLTMNAGGSSGGSAAAVADGLVPLAQGSDGGGSIRIPASMCGVVGMKATFGLVPMVARPDGFNLHTPYAHSGPLARTVQDAALMLDVMIGPHPRDPHSIPPLPSSLTSACTPDVRGMRIAYSPDLGGFPVEPHVATVVDRAVALLAEAGARIDVVTPQWPAPHQEMAALWRRQSAVRNLEAIESYRRAGTDMTSDPEHARLTPGFREVLQLGRRQTLIEYRMDDELRTKIYDAIQDIFDTYDLIVSPVLSVSGVPNAPAGADTIGPDNVAGQDIDPLIGWCLTFPFNFTGHPAASVPAGISADALPVGIQLIGQRFRDHQVIHAATAVEAARHT